MGGPRGLNLLELPDETLFLSLGLLSMNERLSSISLACKRLRELCLAPELLRSVQLAAWGWSAVSRCRSLQLFLAQHAQHVRRLTLHAQLQEYGEDDPMRVDPERQAQLGAAVAGCLAACAAAGGSGGAGLEELVLSSATDVTQADAEQWLPRMQQLRVLWLGREGDALALPPAISQLTALRELGLRAQAITCDGTLRLPASLTRLQVSGGAATELIGQQLSLLTNLRALEGVRSPPDCEAAWSSITGLSSLRSLQLEECEPALPSWLPQLTQLRQLAISGELASEEDEDDVADEAAAARLDAALAPLRQLTCLVLNVMSLPRLPQAVVQLPLQRLLLHTGWGPAPLPCPCPLLASLRWLGLQWQVAQYNLHALAAASHLEHFCLTEIPQQRAAVNEDALWQRFWEWAATHPPLRCLSLEVNPADKSGLAAQLESVVALARRRPGLRIRNTVPPAAADLGWCRSSEPYNNLFFCWEELFARPNTPA